MIEEYIAERMLLSPEYITTLSKTASFRYKKFEIKRRNGKKRTIFSPARELKSVQRFLLDNVLYNLPVHENALAYKKGKGARDVLEIHKDGRYFLKIDFKDFFYSLKKEEIKEILSRYSNSIKPKCNERDIRLITNLCCFNDGIVIGAVTSPLLSNVICYDLDLQMTSKSAERKILYTRYSDDILFSAKEQNILFDWYDEAIDVIRTLKCPKWLRINKNKTVHTSKKRLVKHLGLKITNENSISIGRERKRAIRSLVFKWDSLNSDKRKRLQGFLSYCKAVEPEFISSLCLKYTAERIQNIMKYNGT